MIRFIVFFFVLAVSPFGLRAEEVDNTSHLPIPRFASLRTGEVNMRMGPGMRYPIKWVYARKGLPVEITAEYDIWRRIRDPEGVEGWVSKTELTGKRAAFMTEARDLLKNDRQDAGAAAHLEKGAVGQILWCKLEWCKVRFGDAKGFLRKASFWGAYPQEKFD